MTLRIRIISSLLMTLALAGIGCHRVKSAGRTDEGDPGIENRKLKIGIYMVPDGTGKCAVDFPVARLIKKKNHTAGWYSADKGQYRIDWLKSSPFANGGSITTDTSPKVYWGGPLSGAPDYYPYSVTNLAQPGTPCKEAIALPGDYDPGLHVTP